MYYLFVILMMTLSTYVYCSVEHNQPSSLMIKTEESVTIFCKVSGYSLSDSSKAPSWIRYAQGKTLEFIGMIHSGGGIDYKSSLKNKFTISRDTSTNTVYLQGHNLHVEDTAVYYCVRYTGDNHAFDYWGKGTMVTVSSAEPSGPQYLFGLSECGSVYGEFLTLGCIAKGFSPADSLKFTWKDHKGEPVNNFVQYPTIGWEGDYTQISHLRVKKSDFTPDKPYKCEAGKKEVPVAPAPPAPDQHASLYLTTPTNEELDSGTATFICLAKHFSPEQHSFKWFHDDMEVKSEEKSDECVVKKKTNVTLFTATSILQLKAYNWTNPGNKIKCVFEHKAGNKMKEQSYTVSFTNSDISAHFVPPSWEDMLKNKGGSLTCKASGDIGFKQMEIKMKESGRQIITSSYESIANKKNVEIATTIGFEEWSNGTHFLCIIEHEASGVPIEIEYVRENNGHPYKRPSVYILAPPEQREGESVTLTCYVKDFYPMEVFVSWLADDEPLLGYTQNTSMPILNDKTYSVYSQLTLDSSKWKNGTVFSCVVYHETIDETLKVLTRSITNNSDKPSIFNLSMNTPACCKG